MTGTTKRKQRVFTKRKYHCEGNCGRMVPRVIIGFGSGHAYCKKCWYNECVELGIGYG